MNVSLTDADEAGQALSEKLDSHRWWVFVGAPAVLPLVEERYYSGEANGDFEVMLGPPLGPFADVFPDGGILPLAFAHKRRMSAAQLAGLLRSRGADVTAATLERQDIIFIAETA